MAFTSIKSDPCRIEKELQQATGSNRHIMNVPGPGSKIDYFEDPFIRLQKWGANLMTNTINLESNLMGLSRSLNNDCVDLNNYKNHEVKTKSISYGSRKPSTEQPRASMPAWTARDLEQNRFEVLPLNPQENICYPFHNNLNTRLLEKDYFVQQPQCFMDSTTNTSLPAQTFMNNSNNVCFKTNSCLNL
jgi:hypothetical protein